MTAPSWTRLPKASQTSKITERVTPGNGMVTTVQPTLRGRDANGADYISRDFDDQDPASLDRWAKATLKRLSDTGFRGVGAWSNPILHNYDIPMTQDLNLSGWTHGQANMVFSPDWPATGSAWSGCCPGGFRR